MFQSAVRALVQYPCESFSINSISNNVIQIKPRIIECAGTVIRYRSSKREVEMFHEIIKVVGTAIVCVYGVRLVWLWIKDLLFYRANNWDFSKDSDRKMYPGGGKGSMRGIASYSNKQRVMFGFPLMISVWTIIVIIIFVFEFWNN